MISDRSRSRIRSGSFFWMVKSMITMKDIAQRCGVSVSTVSRVLSGNELISPKTAGAVLKTAETMGYMPDMIAKTLKTNRSDMIGILYDMKLTHPYFSGVVESVRKNVEEAGFDVLLLSRVKHDGRMGYTETALSRRMDGIIVVYEEVGNESVNKLARGHIPVVSIDVYEGKGSTVFSDYRQGTRKLMDYAISRGHRRIALIHGQMGYQTRERLEGFRTAIRDHGLEIPEEYIRAGSFNHPESCVEETEKLLALRIPPTCILMPDDYSAVNALRILREKGVSAPAQFSCAGYDGIPLSQAVTPRLTTFCQDTESIGREAVETLLKNIQAEQKVIREITVPGHLIPGETVADIR